MKFGSQPNDAFFKFWTKNLISENSKNIIQEITGKYGSKQIIT